MNKEHSKSLISIDELPEDIQLKIIEHYERQTALEEYKQQIKESKELAKQIPTSNITINNHNTYYITNNTRILKNEGTINEKHDSLLDMFAKATGRAAGKTWAWLEKESK